MKTIVYVPKACRGEDATFEGQIEIKALGIEEKMNLFSDLGIEGEAGEDGLVHVKKGKGNMAFLVAALRLAKPKYVSVKLKNKASGEEFNSYDDLDSDAECHGILSEVATAMLNGYKVGNG